jgi:hypothetical protein
MLISSTLPAGLLEVAQILGAAEKTLSTPGDNISISYDFNANLASISASIPFIPSDPGASGIGQTPTDYAQIEDFDAGSLGALLAGGAEMTSPATALIKISAAMKAAEIVKTAAGGNLPDGAGISLSVDYESRIISLAAFLPIVMTIDAAGRSVITASNYLA